MSRDPAELLALADIAIDRVLPRLQSARDQGDVRMDTKSSATDIVTEFDQWSEATIVETIIAARPDDGFIGEEGATITGTSGVVWLIDPIDGTTNFVYDLPGSSVSIAARVDDITMVGAVHDIVRDERFRAARGEGATLDGAPITPTRLTDVSTALVATGFSYDANRRRAQASALVELLPNIRDIRRLGGAAIDLCMVACGRVDAYYERGLSPWDFAAGELIAIEAGARIENRDATGGAVVAASPAIAEEFFSLVERAGIHLA
ncbi:MAG: myo-inositol-1(or 4)-monophosphatase [Candidatus Aldehydirespiratoraceae bacterium]|jgi:myo-inositol-1(or 4)-monophosphatase